METYEDGKKEKFNYNATELLSCDHLYELYAEYSKLKKKVLDDTYKKYFVNGLQGYRGSGGGIAGNFASSRAIVPMYWNQEIYLDVFYHLFPNFTFVSTAKLDKHILTSLILDPNFKELVYMIFYIAEHIKPENRFTALQK